MRSRGPAEGPGPGAPPGGQAPAIRVVDHLQGRVRRPVDLLRCLADLIQVALAIGIGLAASAAAGGTQHDIVGASRRLPEPLLDLARPVAPIALLILPVALAARQVYRRQLARLAEGIATGLLAALVVALLNLLLHTASLESVYDAIALSRAGVHNLAPLDPALAALAAFTTTIGLSGRPRWRAAVWLTVIVYSLVSLLASQASVLGLVIALLLGRVVGLGVRYVAGYQARRPAAAEIALALGPAGRGITDMLRLPGREAGARRYAAILDDGRRLDIMVLDRDQQAAGLLYRLYRSVRLQAQVSRTALLSLERVVERRALMSYAATEAGVATPRLRAVVQAGPEAIVLAYDHHPGTTLNELRPRPDDGQLGQIWDEVLRLHEHRITHRGLTADQLQVTNDGGVMLLGLGNGDVAATDLQIRLDHAQLIAELAVLVGPDRSVDLAREKLGAAELAAVVPLLQPVAMHRSTRKALQRDREVLPAVRRQLLGPEEPDEVSPAQLERIRPRALVTLIAGVAAVYLLASQLAEVDVAELLRSADWRWTLAALILSASTYIGAAYSLSGFVLERLRTVYTFLVQVAGSFVTLVTPPAVGGVALNIRYLRRSGVSAADSAASVGVTQAVAFALHAALLVIVAAITGTSSGHSLRPPTWALYLIAAGLAVLLVIIAIPAGRRLLWARAAPMLGEVIPRLLDVAQKPVKLAQGLGGAFLLTVAYILCLDASIRALGGAVPLASVALVYLTGNAIGSLMPTPGGLGAVEAALSAGLTAAGLPGATAISAVLLFRTLTFWLPVPVGWASLSYLQRKNVL